MLTQTLSEVFGTTTLTSEFPMDTAFPLDKSLIENSKPTAVITEDSSLSGSLSQPKISEKRDVRHHYELQILELNNSMLE